MNQQIEFDSIITSDGIEYSLNNFRNVFTWAISGQGIPPITMRTERGPFQHGDTILGFVLRPREIILKIRANTCSRQEYWDTRTWLLNIVRPNRYAGTFDTLTLRKKLPDGSKRDIKAIIQDGPDFRGSDNNKWDEWSIQETLRFVCHDPIFFDPDSIIESMDLSPYENEWDLSWSFPMSFSRPIGTPNNTIEYYGNWLTYPIIYLQGPLREPEIHNITTGERIKLDYTIPINRTVTIDLEYGNKTVKDDLGTNLIGTTTTDSDLATFHLAPAPEAPDGKNEILTWGYDSVLDTSAIRIKYFTKYIGI